MRVANGRARAHRGRSVLIADGCARIGDDCAHIPGRSRTAADDRVRAADDRESVRCVADCPGILRAADGWLRPVTACRKRDADGCEVVPDGRVSVARNLRSASDDHRPGADILCSRPVVPCRSGMIPARARMVADGARTPANRGRMLRAGRARFPDRGAPRPDGWRKSPTDSGRAPTEAEKARSAPQCFRLVRRAEAFARSMYPTKDNYWHRDTVASRAPSSSANKVPRPLPLPRDDGRRPPGTCRLPAP
jgi:hypothetical protein